MLELSVRAFAPSAIGLALLSAATGLFGATQAEAGGGAASLLYERTVMTAANGRCRLFTPQIAAALDASRIQARGAALRSGARSDDLREVERRARSRADTVDCSSKDMSTAADRVRKGFEGYTRMIKMIYPGDVAGWTADRSVSRDGIRWMLLQTGAFGWDRLRFGLTGQHGEPSLTAVGIFADGAKPYAARLVIRDLQRTSGPYLDHRSRGVGGKLSLPSRVPPRSATRVFTAEARATAEPMLLFGESRGGWRFRFSPAAGRAMAELDPREAVVVEFLFDGQGGGGVRQAYVEVGDFAAGRAFLAASQR
ncbi:MAG: hypothetical protein QE280_11175 [Caulobacter sp.]|nr:hypothetical protein [Caulobacter sp.]